MDHKSYNKLGKFILCFSIISSVSIVFLSLRGGNFIEHLNNTSFSSSLLSMITFLLFTIGGFTTKNKYPEYYKYQIASGLILLSTCLIFNIIPRIIFLT